MKDSKILKIINMYKNGLSYRKIAEECGVGHTTVSRVISKNKEKFDIEIRSISKYSIKDVEKWTEENLKKSSKI